MSEPFIGEIKMFAGNFAPRGYAFCNGQLLPINQNTALFSLFGTIYGGDGRTTFALPDLRGRLPMHFGNGAGLSNRQIGQKFGVEGSRLTTAEIPQHRHALAASRGAAVSRTPEGQVLAQSEDPLYTTSDGGAMASTALGNAGGGQSHDNMMPSLCVQFIVALIGVFPSRN